jgi:hypothetical protein
MKITKRQLRRIIREALGSGRIVKNPLSLDLGTTQKRPQLLMSWEAFDLGYDDKLKGELEPLLPDDDNYMQGWLASEKNIGGETAWVDIE